MKKKDVKALQLKNINQIVGKQIKHIRFCEDAADDPEEGWGEQGETGTLPLLISFHDGSFISFLVNWSDHLLEVKQRFDPTDMWLLNILTEKEYHKFLKHGAKDFQSKISLPMKILYKVLHEKHKNDDLSKIEVPKTIDLYGEVQCYLRRKLLDEDDELKS
jgi:hypothetical protein